MDPGMEKHHNREGKFGVSESIHVQPVNHMMEEAFKEIGVPLGDVNGELEDQGFFSVGRAQQMIESGRRLGAYKSFVEPILGKADISVLTYAHVTKVLFSGTKAVGVEIDHFGTRYHYKVQKEVVISGGVIGSPQILMLSGVGPAAELKKHNIPLVKDLPV